MRLTNDTSVPSSPAAMSSPQDQVSACAEQDTIGSSTHLRPSSPAPSTASTVHRSQSPAKRLKSEEPPPSTLPDPMDEDTQELDLPLLNRDVSVDMLDGNVESSSEGGGVSLLNASVGSSTAPSTTTSSADQAVSTAATSIASRPPPPIEELARAILDARFNPKFIEGDDWYIISVRWLNKLLSQAPGTTTKLSKEEAEEELGPIDNSDLVDTANQQQQQENKKNTDESTSFIPFLFPGCGRKENNSAEDTRMGGDDDDDDDANPGSPKGETDNDSTISDFIPIKGVLGEDFEVLPVDVWDSLVSWYGIAKGSPVITRKVVDTAEDSGSASNLQVELFPPTFTVHKLRDPAADISKESLVTEKSQSPKKVVFGKAEGFQKFLKKIKGLAGVESGRKVRLWRILASTGGDAEMSTKTAKKNGKEKGTGTLRQLIIDLQAFLDLAPGEERELVELKDHTEDKNYNGKMRISVAGLGAGGTIVIEEQASDGEWISDKRVKIVKKFGENVTVAQHGGKSPFRKICSRSSSPSKASTSNSNGPTIKSGIMTRGLDKKEGRPKGKCGLSNLGNTCYMNSALQCLRTVEELAKYFLYDEYEKELNPSNPLSHNGKVAKAYGSLIKNIFSPTCPTSFPPRDFKNVIGRFGPSFSGYQQQDSQEFLAFLLDGLHEDLNRIQKKPYTEKPESTDEMVGDMKAIAKLADAHWDIYKKRNDSAVADLFAGLYQSTLVCPECQKVSITFDPFMDLTLPLPIENIWQKDIIFFPKNQGARGLIKIPVEMDKHSTIQSLKEYLGNKLGIDPKTITGSEVYKSKFYKHYEDFNPVHDQIHINDDAYFYELDDIPTNWPEPKTKKSKKSSYSYDKYSDDDKDENSPECDRLLVPVFSRVPNRSRLNSLDAFGVPFFIVLTREEARSMEAIQEKLLEKYQLLTTKDLYENSGPASEEEEEEEEGEQVERPKDFQEKVEDVEKDGFVDIPMKSASSQTSEVTERITRKEPARRKIPRNLCLNDVFTLKALKKSRDAIVPTGWSGLENTIDMASRLGSRPQSPTQSLSKRKSDSVLFPSAGNSGRLSPASNISDEDADAFEDAPEPQQDSMRDISDEEEENMAISSDEFSTSNFLPIASDNFYGNTSANSSKRNFKSPPRSPSPVFDEGPLVKYGEAIVVDWNLSSHSAVFGGIDDDDFPARPLWSKIPVFNDPELNLRRQKREDRRRKGIHLEDCLDEFAKNEILSEEDPWYCPRCKEHRRASKKFELWKCPDILVIHLKRFSSSRNFRDKIDALIECPVEGLDLSNRVGLKEEGQGAIYDLIAVDNHYGGLGGGHYTAFAKNWVDKKWYSCDDSSVREVVDQDKVVTPAAYLLFYRRRASKTLGGPEYERVLSAATANTASSDDEGLPVGGGGHSDDSLIPVTVNGEARVRSSKSVAGFGMSGTTVGNDALWGPSPTAPAVTLQDEACDEIEMETTQETQPFIGPLLPGITKVESVGFDDDAIADLEEESGDVDMIGVSGCGTGAVGGDDGADGVVQEVRIDEGAPGYGS